MAPIQNIIHRSQFENKNRKSDVRRTITIGLRARKTKWKNIVLLHRRLKSVEPIKFRCKQTKLNQIRNKLQCSDVKVRAQAGDYEIGAAVICSHEIDSNE